MIIMRPHPFVTKFVDDVLENVKFEKITKSQKQIFSLVLTMMSVLCFICWDRFSRSCLGTKCSRAISKVIMNPLFPLSAIFVGSVKLMISKAGYSGKLVIDDTDNPRSKGAKFLHKLFLSFDKKTNGFIKLQNIVILLYVTNKLTIPVGFRFFAPDPEWVKWRQEDMRLRKLKVKKSERPKKPLRNSNYSTRNELAIELVTEFQTFYPRVNAEAFLVDAGYCPRTMIKEG